MVQSVMITNRAGHFFRSWRSLGCWGAGSMAGAE
jgi:hypothetical protein